MKKGLLLIILILTSTILVGCKEEIVTEDRLSVELNRLLTLLPEEIEQDTVLPDTLDDFELQYSIDQVVLQNRLLQYQGRQQDYTVYILITLILDSEVTTYYFGITMKKLPPVTELSVIDQAFLEINHFFPERMVSNTTLPEVSLQDVLVNYVVDCTEVVRGRLVYTFPEEDQACTLEASVTYQDETETRDISFVMSAYDLLPQIPAIYITTNQNEEINSNEVYVQASMTLDSDENPLFPTIEDASLGIRLRGNSTLYMPKKSYRIKFDEKTKLLSDYAENDWVLLANYTDQTLVRNYVAYHMGTKLEMEFVPTYRFVDLYINGEYQGNYMLSDQIEVTNDCLDIEENTTNIDTGYLVEYDLGLYRVGLENSGENYFLLNGIPFVIKSPNFEDPHYQEAQKEYIETYFHNLYNVLVNKEDYRPYIDLDSWIDWFIVSEVFKNVDSGYSSVYFYKDAGGKLKMGPLWDFDLSSGNQGHLGDDIRGPEGWYTARGDKNIFFNLLMEYESFKIALKARWNEVYDPTLLSVLDDVLRVSDSITHSRYRNFEKWDVIGKNFDWYTAKEVYALETYDEQVWFLYDYLETRLHWLNENINGL